jgi:hypothetical protein
MSNIAKVLDILTEGSSDIITKEMFAKATKLGMSREEVAKYSKNVKGLEKKLDSLQNRTWKDEEKADRRDSAKLRKDAPKEPKEASYTDAQYKKMCKGAADDWKADNDHDEVNGAENDMSIEDVAYDMADSMLYDPKIVAYLKKKLGSSYSREKAKEYLADDLVG